MKEVALSLLVPCYREERRLPRLFSVLRGWLAAPPRAPAEVLLADDGSDDGTLALMRAFAAEMGGERVRVLALPHRGKGHTVRSGVLASRGEAVLFSDVDLATPLRYARPLLAELERGHGVAIAVREGPGARREGISAFRRLLGRGFNALVQFLLVSGVCDSQCGFKAFTRRAADAIFGCLAGYRDDAPELRGPSVTAFDVEVLFLARRLGFRIAQVPVHWTHDADTRVRPGVDALRMAWEVLGMKWRDWRGAYPLPAARGRGPAVDGRG